MTSQRGRQWRNPSAGRVSLALLGLLIVSGILLAKSFHPRNAASAQAELEAIQEASDTLAYVRSIHSWSALLFLVASAAHMMRAWRGRLFRGVQKVNWVAGLLLLSLALLISASGYLLRWDVLSLTLARLTLLEFSGFETLDAFIQQLAFGIESSGTIPLGRIYLLHVLGLPLLLVIGTVAHVMRAAEEKTDHSQSGWLGLLPTAVIAYVAILLLAGLPLEPAVEDPNSISVWPQPEWLWLLHLLPSWLAPTSARWVGTLLLPLLYLLVTVLIPWIDRESAPRLLSLGLFAAGMMLVVAILGGTAVSASEVPYGACGVCHQPGIIGSAPSEFSELDSSDPSWLLFHMRQPVESILVPSN